MSGVLDFLGGDRVHGHGSVVPEVTKRVRNQETLRDDEPHDRHGEHDQQARDLLGDSGRGYAMGHYAPASAVDQ
jgi:hypothetical protein